MLPAARRTVTTLALFGFIAATAVVDGAATASDLRALPPQPADVPWPTSSWPAGPLPDGVAQPLEAALDVVKARDETLGETRAVVIIHHGRLVAERYMPGFGPETPLISWSMAKSVTQALVGVAVRRGLVDIDKPMGNPRWDAGDPRSLIPWRSWINMVDGQDYHEIGVFNQTKNDAARMLFGIGRLDVAGFGATLPLVHAPGTHWNYNSAGVNLIADALGRVYAPGGTPDERRARVAAALHDDLFIPIGMTSARPQFDAAGTFIGSALVYATARDWARFGLLYLRDGVWDEHRILPEGWVDFARSKTPASDCDIYGAGWWVSPEAGRGKPYPALAPNGPRDVFRAQGFQGQIVAVVPSKDLVIVRLGHLDDRIGWRALSDWLERIFPFSRTFDADIWRRMNDISRAPPIISVQNLSKTYASGFQALKNVDLEIRRGEIFALLGPNGAGKTTLIGVICGIVNPTSGKVVADGHDIVTDFRAARSKIGLVPQELSTDLFETVWATVTFSRGLFGKPKNPARVEKVLRDLSLWDKRDSKIMTLSGGMKRRVLIAKALSHDPQILFLDEPTAGVDVELRRDMWAMVRSLQGTGATIILTTHYIEEAEQMADRIGIIDKGEIILVEDKAALMEKLGKKQLIVHLAHAMDAVPAELSAYRLERAGDGARLVYTYDAQRDGSTIPELLAKLGSLGIGFKDLESRESSLEEIFVSLVRSRS